MARFEFGLITSLFLFFFLLSLIDQSFQLDNSCQNCKTSDYKRCYNISTTNSECKCLRGLYQLNERCLGVLRYDMKLKLFLPPVIKAYSIFAQEIKNFFKKIPTKSSDSLVNSNFDMDIEDWFIKKKNPKDLPTLQLEQMTDFLKSYFKSNSKNVSKDMILIDDLEIGKTDINTFIESFSIKYNELTCKTERYNYCYEHNWCTSHLGSVNCKCDLMTSIDVSPQKELFPGEQCEEGCSKKCKNEGICRYKENKFACYCIGWYVGESCQISIIWFLIITSTLIILFCLLSVLCGFLEGYRRNRKKKSAKQTQ